jgi:hypothetical protein
MVIPSSGPESSDIAGESQANCRYESMEAMQDMIVTDASGRSKVLDTNIYIHIYIYIIVLYMQYNHNGCKWAVEASSVRAMIITLVSYIIYRYGHITH